MSRFWWFSNQQDLVMKIYTGACCFMLVSHSLLEVQSDDKRTHTYGVSMSSCNDRLHELITILPIWTFRMNNRSGRCREVSRNNDGILSTAESPDLEIEIWHRFGWIQWAISTMPSCKQKFFKKMGRPAGCRAEKPGPHTSYGFDIENKLIIWYNDSYVKIMDQRKLWISFRNFVDYFSFWWDGCKECSCHTWKRICIKPNVNVEAVRTL